MSRWEQKIFYKWLHAWAISDINTKEEIQNAAKRCDFYHVKFNEITSNIQKSAWRMFYGSFFMTVLSGLYRIYNPKVSHFADNHYKSLFYQYPALKKELWKYFIIKIKR